MYLKKGHVCMYACVRACLHVGTRASVCACVCVCVFLTCCPAVKLRAVEFAPVGGIKMPMCIGLGVAATTTHKVQMLVGLQLRVRLA